MASDENPTSLKEVVSVMNEQSDGTSLIKEYKKTFSNPDGTDKAGDIMAPSTEQALPILKDLIEKTKSKIKNESKRKIWDFTTSPHAQFNKTLDDTFMSFLMWARVSDTSNGNEVNVAKAFRRLETYAEWMDDTGTDLIEPPLSASSIKKALDAWNMKSTLKTDGTYIWWVDMGKIDREYIKKELTPEDSLRAFVWYSHYVMYHENAQNNGIIFIQNIAKIGMIKLFTLMPAKLGAKLDRLTIGVLPVKMKAIYCLESPTWANILMKVIGVFMSKKMKERFVMLNEWDKLEEILGSDCIPKGFGKLEGSLEKDLLEKEYFPS